MSFLLSGVTALAGGGELTYKDFNLTAGDRGSSERGYRNLSPFFYGSLVPDDYGNAFVARLDSVDQGLGVARYTLWIQGATSVPPVRFFDELVLSGDFDTGNAEIRKRRSEMSAATTGSNIAIWTWEEVQPQMVSGNVYLLQLSPEVPLFET